MMSPVKQEKVLYLLDPIGASRRSATLRAGDAAIRAFAKWLPVEHDALELPYTPDFLQKHDGLVMSIGQFNQWVGGQLMASGLAQVWPGTPVSTALFDGNAVTGVRLADQGVHLNGSSRGRLHGRDGRARRVNRGGRRAGGSSWTEHRQQAWNAARTRAARVGSRHEDGG